MPQAGWCRECRDWVWVDKDGGCRNGHDASCVGGIYETSEVPGAAVAVTEQFGVGEMPPELDRFNWGAFLLPLPWGVWYTLWPVVSLWMVMALTPLVLALLVSLTGEEQLVSSALGITIVSEVIGGVIRLWIGVSATRMLWARESLRLRVVERAQPRLSSDRYRSRQKKWTIAGIVVNVLGLAGLALLTFSNNPSTVQLRTQQGIRPLDAGLSAFWLVVEVGLALWLASRMQTERAADDPAGPGGGPR
jgi:hypothetical protein